MVEGVPADIALLTGPMLLGNLFGYGLYGILVVQLFIYHIYSYRDSRRLKGMVWSVFIVDTLITIFATVAAWNALAKGWGNSSTLAPLDWPFGGLPFLSGLVATTVHLFFCWRIWILRSTVILPVGIALVSFLSWATASYCGIHGRSLGIVGINRLKPFVIIWLGGSALCDMVITMTMLLTLFGARNQTAFKETKSLLSRLITLTMETGMATSIGAITELIFFLVYPNNNMHFLPFLLLAKLYSNTLLATLNARGVLGRTRNASINRPPLWKEDEQLNFATPASSARTEGQMTDPEIHIAMATQCESTYDSSCNRGSMTMSVRDENIQLTSKASSSIV